jgi:translation initiation factor 2 alpha subunit (eIF-2alpha)
MYVKSEFELTCFNSNGIDGIINALQEGEKILCQTTRVNKKIALIYSPIYIAIIETNVDSAAEDVEIMKKVIHKIHKIICSYGGTFKLHSYPRIWYPSEYDYCTHWRFD